MMRVFDQKWVTSSTGRNEDEVARPMKLDAPPTSNSSHPTQRLHPCDGANNPYSLWFQQRRPGGGRSASKLSAANRGERAPGAPSPVMAAAHFESELGHLFPGVHRVNIEVPTRIGDDEQLEPVRGELTPARVLCGQLQAYLG